MMLTPYYQTETSTIYHGDCTEIIAELSLQCDVIITDPPYSKHTHAKHLSTVKIDRQSLGFEEITKDKMVELARRWTEIAQRWVIFTCDYHFMEDLFISGILTRFGIWRKPNSAPQFTGDRPGIGWEAVAICHRQGEKRWNGGGRHAFWECNVDRNSIHPTAKPEKLIRSFVTDFSEIGELILDPFMGSGTTLRAAKDLNRRCIGIECDEKWCEYAAKRLAQETLSLSV